MQEEQPETFAPSCSCSLSFFAAGFLCDTNLALVFELSCKA